MAAGAERERGTLTRRCVQDSEQWDQWVATAFRVFDEDGTGLIGVKELTRMLCSDGLCPMPDIVMAALRCASSAQNRPWR